MKKPNAYTRFRDAALVALDFPPGDIVDDVGIIVALSLVPDRVRVYATIETLLAQPDPRGAELEPSEP